MPRKHRGALRLKAWFMILTLALAFALVPAPAHAATTTVTFSNFSDISDLVLSGNTAGYGNPIFFGGQHVLRLTRGLGQAGGAFLRDPIALTDSSGFKASFSTAFAFQITAPVGCVDSDGVQGADGLVFVVQTTSNQYGASGGGIGYQGIPKSVGIEFDTWNNGGVDRGNGNHVGIDVNGSVNSVAFAPVTEGHMNNQNVWHAWVDYDGDTQELEVRVSQSSTRPASPTLRHTIDLPAVLESPDAYVGFTSGTGCAGGQHDIRNWEFTNTYRPIGACDDGVTFLPPLSSTANTDVANGSTVGIKFKYCNSGSFVHDESVIILISDAGMPIAAWVYGSDIVIDDGDEEYRQDWDTSLYGLSPGQVLMVEVYLNDMLMGTAQVTVTP